MGFKDTYENMIFRVINSHMIYTLLTNVCKIFNMVFQENP